jgi:ribosomal protein S18 acetylase RimI-like enzyme
MKAGYTIVNASPEDLPIICHLFDEAILFQKKHNYIGWSSYDQEYIQADIAKGLLFKLVINDTIAGIFSICYTDRLIWRQKEQGDAIYLHRIVLHQQFKGEKIFQKILAWAIEETCKKNLRYIRMDTWADNEKIIGYYKSYHFKFVETYTTADTPDLPTQHRNLKVALLEFDVTGRYKRRTTLKTRSGMPIM